MRREDWAEQHGRTACPPDMICKALTFKGNRLSPAFRHTPEDTSRRPYPSVEASGQPGPIRPTPASWAPRPTAQRLTLRSQRAANHLADRGKRGEGTPRDCSGTEPAVPNGRCRMHGGKSTGPRSVEGLERMRRAKTKHGSYSAMPAPPMRALAREYCGYATGFYAANIAIGRCQNSRDASWGCRHRRPTPPAVIIWR
jgi:hypothetical protein